MRIFCNSQTTVERQYFSAIKKCITWNSAQTWVTKIVNHHGTWATLICSQAAICLLRKNLRANFYIIEQFTGTILEWSEYHKENYEEFALINWRRSSNLGSSTFHANN